MKLKALSLASGTPSVKIACKDLRSGRRRQDGASYVSTTNPSLAEAIAAMLPAKS